MEFRVLGPLEVVRDGVPVTVGGPRPRALLAALLVHHDTVVPTGGLVTAVWPDGPPPRADGALRAYVSRLRTVLAPLPDRERLGHRSRGYRLALGDGELDSAEFESRVRRAREAADRADPGASVEELDAALALWRGDPLAEFDTAALGADPFLTRLAELRFQAREDRAEALLDLGRGAEAVPDLQVLVADAPFRERPAVLLMRALGSCGRQAEALAVFRELRRRLVDELGVEPTGPTQQAHRQLLTPDPAPVAPVRRTGLPRRSSSLVGRDDEERRVAAALGDAALVTLTGPGGVGKSRLALEVADRARDRFPDGTVLVELAPLPAGGPVTSALAAALQIQPRHGLTIGQTLLEYLRSRRSLLVLDNCEHVLDGAAALLDQLLAGCPAVTVLATSREAIGVPGEQVRPVPALPAVRRPPSSSSGHRRSDRTSGWTPNRPAPWPRCAAGSTDCRWPSSWPPPGWGR
jgi:DNA-binding SARP family transcriptional activator